MEAQLSCPRLKINLKMQIMANEIYTPLHSGLNYSKISHFVKKNLHFTVDKQQRSLTTSEAVEANFF